MASTMRPLSLLHRACCLVSLALVLVAINSPLSYGAPGGAREQDVQTAFVESSLHLSSANWTTNIQTGTWFVEFFTPSSPSCKSFAQTWQELTVNKESLRTSYPSAPFALAQVDCSLDTDLCVRESVKHVPKLSLYRDGVQREGEFTGDREYTALSSFVDEQAHEYRALKGVSDAQDTSAENKPPIAGPAPAPAPAPLPGKNEQDTHKAASGDDAADAKDKNGDEKMPANAKVPKEQTKEEQLSSEGPASPNADGRMLQFGIHAVVRDKAALDRFLAPDSEKGSSFVKFFAPWCPHCRAMAAAYSQLPEALRGKLNVIEVDCEANREVCAQYNVRGFPSLRMYSEGSAIDYTGTRTFEAMKNWALKVGGSPGVRRIAATDLNHVNDEDEVFFLYLHGVDTPDHEITAFAKAARRLATASASARAYRSMDEELIDRFKSRLVQSASSASFSGILVFKDHNLVPVAAYHPSQQPRSADLADEVGSWLDTERYPTTVEISGDTFNDVINNKQGLLVVLAALSDVHHSGQSQGTGTGSTRRIEELNTFRDLALKWRQKSRDMEVSLSGTGAGAVADHKKQRILFAWINADRWASAIEKYYHIQTTHLPSLILADGARLQYYDLPLRATDQPPSLSVSQPWLDADRVFETLDLIANGKGPEPKSSRTYLDRGVYETASFVEAILLWVSNHFFTSFFLTVMVVAAIVAYLRHHASYMAMHAQRLPTSSSYGNGKAD